MKTKIQELALQAGLVQYDSDSKIEEINKFAQLLIQDCINQIEKNYVGAVGTYPNTHNSAVHRCVNSVCEYFEIKK